MKSIRGWTLLLLVVLLTGCATSHPSMITPGMAKLYLVPGETHQAKVIEIFGPPNIVTRSDDGDLWVYDKVSSREANTSFGIGGIVGGFGSGTLGIGGLGVGANDSVRSETTVMLIVYYDKNDLVRDYKITQTKF